MSTAIDPAFSSVGKEVGLEIWRIEKLLPVPVPAETYGKFFTGDSYIVLNTYKKNVTIISLQSPQQQPTQPAPQQQPTQSLQLPESAGARETAQSVAPARKRQGRRCGRCLSHGGGDPLACPGRGGARCRIQRP